MQPNKTKDIVEKNNIKPLLNITAPGRGAELKRELIDEQTYNDAIEQLNVKQLPSASP
jgi:hypothetical protein